MGKNVKNIKIAKNSSDRKFDFDIFNRKKFENRTINTKDMLKNVKNTKIAKNLQKGSLTVIVVFFK